MTSSTSLTISEFRRRGRLVEQDRTGIPWQAARERSATRQFRCWPLNRAAAGCFSACDSTPAARLRRSVPRFFASPADIFRTQIGPSAKRVFQRPILREKRLKDWNCHSDVGARLRQRTRAADPAAPDRRCVIVPDSMVSRRLMTRHRVDLPEPRRPGDDDDLAPLRTVRSILLEHVEIAEVLVDYR